MDASQLRDTFDCGILWYNFYWNLYVYCWQALATMGFSTLASL